MTNEVINVATNAVATTTASTMGREDILLLVFSAAFAVLIFALMYLGRPKDETKTDQGQSR